MHYEITTILKNNGKTVFKTIYSYEISWFWFTLYNDKFVRTLYDQAKFYDLHCMQTKNLGIFPFLISWLE